MSAKLQKCRHIVDTQKNENHALTNDNHQYINFKNNAVAKSLRSNLEELRDKRWVVVRSFFERENFVPVSQ